MSRVLTTYKLCVIIIPKLKKSVQLKFYETEIIIWQAIHMLILRRRAKRSKNSYNCGNCFSGYYSWL